jgi:type IV pilus assembly protein PilY1
MKRHPFAPITRNLLSLLIAGGLVLSQPALAGQVALATAPLATSSTSAVSPNIMFMLDDSGSMDWDYMPDTVKNFAGKYGFNSSQCNGVAYNPNITYTPPVKSDGTSYPPSIFTNAPNDGYAGGASSGYTDLSAAYPGGSGTGASGSNLATPKAAFYFTYTGTQTQSYQKDYSNTSGTFYRECNSSFGTDPGVSIGSSPGVSVFTYVTVSATSGPGATDERTNFANWFSYYSTRMMMMKTGVGQAFKSINPSYRVGFMTLNNNVSPDFVNVLPFTGGCSVGSGTCQKDQWYTKLYQANPGSSTPLRQVLSKVGNLYANKYATTYTYTATITVSNNPTSTTSTTTVTSVQECNVLGTCTELMDAPSATVSNSTGRTRRIATNIAGEINATNSPIYSAAASGSVVTIYGNANDLGQTPTLTSSGGGTFTVTAFVKNTQTATLNGVVPLDPVEYSCQKNFVILSTDGYWNGNAGYKLDGSSIGNQDSTAPRPYYDGGLVNQVTTQTSETKEQMTQTISDHYQQETVQLQQSTMYLQTQTKSHGNWGSWSNTSSCTWGSSRNCRYANSTNTGGSNDWSASTATWSGAASCTASYSTDTSNGTVWSGNGTNCQNYDSGWVAVPSCTPGTTAITGGTDTCQMIAGSSGFATSTSGTFNCTNNAGTSSPYIKTTCSLNIIQAATFVASCTSQDASSSNGYVMTICNTSTSTVNNLSSCTSQVPSAGNNYTTITCTGGTGGTSDTLADTAMYYYQTDLRNPSLGNCTGALGAGTDVCTDNVPSSGTDTNPAQHMTTFTLGLGARGKMVYSSTYKSDTSGDYYSVAHDTQSDLSATPPICSWASASNQICNWPAPVSNTSTAIDDLWHAAVNGRGAYYSATDPTTLSSGLASTLAAINQVTGAAAAAATSTLNPVAGNNYAYVASYTTVKWIGNLEQRSIDINTGVVSTTASWCVENLAPPTCVAPNFVVADTSGGSTVNYCAATAIDANGDGSIDALDCTAPMVFDSATTTCRQPINNTCLGTLPPMVGSTSDTRSIYTADSGGTLVPFDAAYATANPTNFSAAHISGLTQWPALVAAGTSANATGVNLINYLRGQYGYEANRTSNPAANWLFRYRDAVMGDALESQPTFVAAPTYNYSDPGYSSFVAAHSSRPGTVYMGTNDGMLHAFAASNGVERWAFVPSEVIPNMWKLADTNYGAQHANFVNGSPVISDICSANCTDAATAIWRTIIVGGLDAGGREYYALDITDPTAPPILLWEFTPSKAAPYGDPNLGYTYARPVITKKQDGTWVVLVASGYDNGTLSSDNATPNSPAGDGKGYLYVLNAVTGAVINAIGTNTGSAAVPSGLAKFNAYSAVEGTNQAGFAYAGDLFGNLWRFDINTAAAPFKVATLADPSGIAQPITVGPTLGKTNGKDIIFVGTGKYLETADLSTTQTQTIYGIVDDNATVTLTNPAGSPRNSNTLIQQTISNTSSTTRSDTNNPVDLSAYRGWYVDLPDSGERANVDFKLVQGTLLAPTIVPSATACSPGGYGWFNYFNYETGGPVDTTGIVSQYYDSPIVGMNVIYIGGNPIVEIVTSNNPTPTPPPNATPFRQGSGGFMQSREVWRELIP